METETLERWTREVIPSSRPAGSKSAFYQPEIDSLRFVAFLGVFLFHSMPRETGFYTAYRVPPSLAAVICGAVNAGGCGVDLFFALSAYLITSLLLKERETTGTLDVKGFYIRRILRIWPLYFAFVFFAYAAPLLVHAQHTLGLRYVIGFTFLAGNWIYVLYGIPLHSVALPLWSVSIEEQFYLTWPLVARRASIVTLSAVAGLLLLAAAGTRAIFLFSGASQASFEFNTLSRIDAIAMGIILALFAKRLPRFTAIQRTVLLCLGISISVGVGMFCGLYPVDNTSVNRWGNIIGRPLVAIASIALLLAVLGIQSAWIRTKWLVYLGKISYGLYVFHELALKVANVAVKPEGMLRLTAWITLGLAITIALAALSYRYLETPFLRMKERFAHVSSRPV
jgi:peptidoglycan/LPS O-acetylase OafA/YrhL